MSPQGTVQLCRKHHPAFSYGLSDLAPNPRKGMDGRKGTVPAAERLRSEDLVLFTAWIKLANGLCSPQDKP